MTYVLIMNDMRSSKIEESVYVCIGSEHELRALLEQEICDSYQDGPWQKSYRKGGPLEWCNIPFATLGQGIHPYTRHPDPPHVSELEFT
jgi:hypothetical protein